MPSDGHSGEGEQLVCGTLSYKFQGALGSSGICEVENAGAIVASLHLSQKFLILSVREGNSLMPQGTDPNENGPECFTLVYPKGPEDTINVLEN